MEVNNQITTIGEMLIDFTQIEGKGYVPHAGGAPANVSIALTMLGTPVNFITRVGDDLFGKMLKEEVAKYLPNTEYFQIDSLHNTTLAFVSLDVEGDRSFDFYRKYGADKFISIGQIEQEAINKSKIFYFGSVSLSAEPLRAEVLQAIRFAKEADCKICFDVNLRELLWDSLNEAKHWIKEVLPLCDVVKFSRDEFNLLYPGTDANGVVEGIQSKGTEIVIISDGEHSTNAYYKSKEVTIPVEAVKAVDTTGAGDTFFAIVMYSLLHINVDDIVTLEHIIMVANKYATHTTLAYGAIDSIATLDFEGIRTELLNR